MVHLTRLCPFVMYHGHDTISCVSLPVERVLAMLYGSEIMHAGMAGVQARLANDFATIFKRLLTLGADAPLVHLFPNSVKAIQALSPFMAHPDKSRHKDMWIVPVGHMILADDAPAASPFVVKVPMPKTSAKQKRMASTEPDLGSDRDPRGKKPRKGHCKQRKNKANSKRVSAMVTAGK